MAPLIISPTINEKLDGRHQVKDSEIKQCFENVLGEYIEETRTRHKTNPPSYWFLAHTNHGRLLKVIFTPRDGNLFIKSAYDANEKAINLYIKLNAGWSPIHE